MNKSNISPAGLICEIYWCTALGECSAGGLSTRHNEVVLLMTEHAPIFEPTIKIPAVKIVRRQIGHQTYVHAEPDLEHWTNKDELARVGKDAHYMAGGTFIFSHDSRFHEFVGHDYPIAFHDRVELPRPEQEHNSGGVPMA